MQFEHHAGELTQVWRELTCRRSKRRIKKKLKLAWAAAAKGSLAARMDPGSPGHRHGDHHEYDGGPVAAGLLGVGAGLAAVGTVAASVVFPALVDVASNCPVVTARVVDGAPRARVVER